MLETGPPRTPLLCPLFTELRCPGTFASAASAIANLFQLHKNVKTIGLLKSALASFQELLKVFTLEKTQVVRVVQSSFVQIVLHSRVPGEEQGPFLVALYGEVVFFPQVEGQLNLEVSCK